MIVTTGGRGARSASSSSKDAGSSSSSAACLIVISRSSSVPMISTSSSESDCVAVRICPRPMRILMSSGIGTPRACERSLTVTPDSTVMGPDGGGAGAWRGCGGADDRSRAWRPALRPPPPSMTTRRFRPPGPPRGRIGRFGPFRPSAISVSLEPRGSRLVAALLRFLDRILDGTDDLELWFRLDDLILDLLERLGCLDRFDDRLNLGDFLDQLVLVLRRLVGGRIGLVDERLMGGHAAVARAGECGVRAALAVRQHGRAAAGKLLAVLRPCVCKSRFLLRELRLRLA